MPDSEQNPLSDQDRGESPVAKAVSAWGRAPEHGIQTDTSSEYADLAGERIDVENARQRAAWLASATGKSSGSGGSLLQRAKNPLNRFVNSLKRNKNPDSPQAQPTTQPTEGTTFSPDLAEKPLPGWLEAAPGLPPGASVGDLMDDPMNQARSSTELPPLVPELSHSWDTLIEQADEQGSKPNQPLEMPTLPETWSEPEEIVVREPKGVRFGNAEWERTQPSWEPISQDETDEIIQRAIGKNGRLPSDTPIETSPPSVDGLTRLDKMIDFWEEDAKRQAHEQRMPEEGTKFSILYSVAETNPELRAKINSADINPEERQQLIQELSGVVGQARSRIAERYLEATSEPSPEVIADITNSLTPKDAKEVIKLIYQKVSEGTMSGTYGRDVSTGWYNFLESRSDLGIDPSDVLDNVSTPEESSLPEDESAVVSQIADALPDTTLRGRNRFGFAEKIWQKAGEVKVPLLKISARDVILSAGASTVVSASVKAAAVTAFGLSGVGLGVASGAVAGGAMAAGKEAAPLMIESWKKQNEGTRQIMVIQRASEISRANRNLTLAEAQTQADLEITPDQVKLTRGEILEHAWNSLKLKNVEGAMQRVGRAGLKGMLIGGAVGGLVTSAMEVIDHLRGGASAASTATPETSSTPDASRVAVAPTAESVILPQDLPEGATIPPGSEVAQSAVTPPSLESTVLNTLSDTNNLQLFTAGADSQVIQGGLGETGQSLKGLVEGQVANILLPELLQNQAQLNTWVDQFIATSPNINGEALTKEALMDSIKSGQFNPYDGKQKLFYDFLTQQPGIGPKFQDSVNALIKGIQTANGLGNSDILLKSQSYAMPRPSAIASVIGNFLKK